VDAAAPSHAEVPDNGCLLQREYFALSIENTHFSHGNEVAFQGSGFPNCCLNVAVTCHVV
jgi:hypothetical protein